MKNPDYVQAHFLVPLIHSILTTNDKTQPFFILYKYNNDTWMTIQGRRGNTEVNEIWCHQSSPVFPIHFFPFLFLLAFSISLFIPMVLPLSPYHKWIQFRIPPPPFDEGAAKEANTAGSCPPIFLLSLFRRERYARLVVFHIEMYFSMHIDRQVSSWEEREVPGLGMQRSKQCSFSFWFWRG